MGRLTFWHDDRLVERLMKLPTENERWTALMRLDRKTNMSFTLGEMKRLCPEHTELALSEPPGWRDKMTEVAARRIGILDALCLVETIIREQGAHAVCVDLVLGAAERDEQAGRPSGS
jgi:hypothetical protein